MYTIQKNNHLFLIVFLCSLFSFLALPGCWDQGVESEWAIASESKNDENYVDRSVVALDAQDNSYIAGSFTGTVDFETASMTANGLSDVFVAKFDSDGHHQWSRSFGDSQGQFAQSIAVDTDGNILVAGYFYGAINFGGGELISQGASDIFVVKLDSNGNHLWSQSFGDSYAQYAHSIAVDLDGNVLIAGHFSGTVNFGGVNLTNNGNQIFIAKFDSTGAHEWSHAFGNLMGQYLYSIATDSDGNVLIAGYFYDTLNLGGTNLKSKGSYDIFLAKFGSNGTHQWSQSFGDSQGQYVYAIALDQNQNILITGGFYGNVNFGGNILVSKGYNDVFIAKFDGNGVHQWSKSFGDSGDQSAHAIAVDTDGDIAITGSFDGILNFGNGDLINTAVYNVFVTTFDAAGNSYWSKSFGDVNDQVGSGIDFTNSGRVVCTGTFEGVLDLTSEDLGVFTSVQRDLFLMEILD